METLIRKLFTYFLAVSSIMMSITVFSDTLQVAQAGTYGEDGEIQLRTEIFLDTFPDGLPVKDLKIVSVNGFMHVSRKGYSENGACRTELIPLVEKNGNPLVEGSDPLMGKPAFITSLTPMRIIRCSDDGCHALRDVHIPGEPKPISALCDITDASDNKCACHINRGYGQEIVRDGLFCESNGYWLDVNIVHWVHIEYMSIEEITY